jgi:hypothetical protein
MDHFNSGDPHSHVAIRRQDEMGSGFIIAQGYITVACGCAPKSVPPWN